MREPRLAQLFREAIALLVPSLSYEVFPLVILEAFRQGTPAVVPRLGAMPGIVESAEAGFVYSTPEELAESLRTLEDRPDVRAAMGRRASHAFQQNWTPDAHLERYFSILRELAEAPRQARA